MIVIRTLAELSTIRNLTGRYCLQFISKLEGNHEIPVIMNFPDRGDKSFKAISPGVEYYFDINQKVSFTELGHAFYGIGIILITRMGNNNSGDDFMPLASISNNYSIFSVNI